MSGNRYDIHVKEKVALLRTQGKSYAEIRKEFPIPKSTLSVWLGEKCAGIFDRKAQLTHLKRVRPLALRAIQKRVLTENAHFSKIGKEIAAKISADTNFYKAMLAMLYWAEGAKHRQVSGLKFVNTDPKLALLYLSLLRKSYEIDEARLRIRLHLHSYHHQEKSIDFWSQLLQVPRSQFGKLYIKPRSKTRKFRENFMGICFISYGENKIRKEILSLAYALADLHGFGKKADILYAPDVPLSSFNG